MSLRIEEGIRVTEPCSSASHVISEDSDLYRPLKAPPVFLDREIQTQWHERYFQIFSRLSRNSQSLPPFFIR